MNVFAPEYVNDLTTSEKKKTLQELMLMTEKKDKNGKGQMVCNGKPPHGWMSRDDAPSLMASLENDEHDAGKIVSKDPGK